MLKILDLSHRLPGPYAAKRLVHLGFFVTRIEDLHYPDPFISADLEHINPQFLNWHKELSNDKLIIKLDLNQDEDLKKLKELFRSHNIVINSRGERFLNNLGLDEDFCLQHKILVVNLKASKEEPHLHDLNALAQSSLLNYHLEHFKDNLQAHNKTYFPPPFLPIAGLAFGHGIAENILASVIKKEVGIKHLYLDEEVNNSLGHLKHPNSLALHNGKFPSYGIYPLKEQNHFVAIALIEEKFWMQFIQEAKLNLSPSDRFSTEKEVFQTMSNFFISHDSDSLRRIFHKPLSCITTFKI